jgi:DNA-binding NtrC family response regulator
LRPWLLPVDGSGCIDRAAGDPNASGFPVGTSLQDMERTLIETTLNQFSGHRERTAKALGIGVRTLANKLRSYGYAPREKSYHQQISADAA